LAGTDEREDTTNRKVLAVSKTRNSTSVCGFTKTNKPLHFDNSLLRMREEELKEYGEIDSEESIQEKFDRDDALYRKTAEHGHGGYHAGSSGTEYGGKDSSILSMAQGANGRRENSGEAERDRQGGLRDQ
jgi:hypothetical protein